MANNIRALRKAAGLTLQELADKAGMGFQQLSRLERGGRRLTDDWMRQIAGALDVPPASLMSNPNEGEMVDDPDELALLRFWRVLSTEQRRGMLLLLGAEADRL